MKHIALLFSLLFALNVSAQKLNPISIECVCELQTEFSKSGNYIATPFQGLQVSDVVTGAQRNFSVDYNDVSFTSTMVNIDGTRYSKSRIVNFTTDADLIQCLKSGGGGGPIVGDCVECPPNEPGPQGEAGPPGESGADGADGAPGTPGADGAGGPKGDTGDAGPAGADGEDGDDGILSHDTDGTGTGTITLDDNTVITFCEECLTVGETYTLVQNLDLSWNLQDGNGNVIGDTVIDTSGDPQISTNSGTDVFGNPYSPGDNITVYPNGDVVCAGSKVTVNELTNANGLDSTEIVINGTTYTHNDNIVQSDTTQNGDGTVTHFIYNPDGSIQSEITACETCPEGAEAQQLTYNPADSTLNLSEGGGSIDACSLPQLRVVEESEFNVSGSGDGTVFQAACDAPILLDRDMRIEDVSLSGSVVNGIGTSFADAVPGGTQVTVTTYDNNVFIAAENASGNHVNSIMSGSNNLNTSGGNPGRDNFTSGQGNNTRGNSNVVSGNSNTTRGICNLVSGITNNNTGWYGIVSGSTNIVTNNFNLTVGASNEVDGDAGLWAGRRNDYISGANSGGLGQDNITEGNNNWTIGGSNKTLGNSNSVLGTQNQLNGSIGTGTIRNNNILYGFDNQLNANNTITGGQFNDVTEDNSIVIGSTNTVTKVGAMMAAFGNTLTVEAPNSLTSSLMNTNYAPQSVVIGGTSNIFGNQGTVDYSGGGIIGGQFIQPTIIEDRQIYVPFLHLWGNTPGGAGTPGAGPQVIVAGLGIGGTPITQVLVVDPDDEHEIKEMNISEIVTQPDLYPIHDDDNAAAAAGVAIGEVYELSATNSYGLVEGLLKVRRI